MKTPNIVKSFTLEKNGGNLNVQLVYEVGIIIKIEKWDELNVNTQTSVTSGGGHLSGGNGYISPSRTTVNTQINSVRNTRIYYIAGGQEKAITGIGLDIEALEGNEIMVSWYKMNRFHDKIAQIFNFNNLKVYTLTSPASLFSGWLGFRTINLSAIPIIIGVYLVICYLCFSKEKEIGMFVSIFGGVCLFFGLAPLLFRYLVNPALYTSNKKYYKFVFSIETEMNIKVQDFVKGKAEIR